MEFFVYFTREEGEQMSPPSPEGVAEMQRLMQEGMSSGLIVATGQLASTATHLRLDRGELSLTEGPFMGGRELIPGFTIIKVDSKQEAVDWMAGLRRCMGDGELRMAQIFRPGMD
jgi:hypothetical protein